MLEEEGTVIVGMLVGLNVIDANLCVKGEDLDSQVKHTDVLIKDVLSFLLKLQKTQVNIFWYFDRTCRIMLSVLV